METGGNRKIEDIVYSMRMGNSWVSANTDGVLFKLYRDEDYDKFVEICEEWSKRTRMDLDYDEYVRIYQKDVNNYLAVEPNGKYKCKGAYVKKLSPIDNNLPIVNKAVVNYFLYGKPVEDTVNESNELIDFQIVKKIGSTYEYVFKENSKGEYHKYTKVTYKTRSRNKVKYKERVVIDDSKYGKKLHTVVNRIFASTMDCHGGAYKKHKEKDHLDKLPGTPDKCFILNSDIRGKTVPTYLDRKWYIDLAKSRINDFIGR